MSTAKGLSRIAGTTLAATLGLGLTACNEPCAEAPEGTLGSPSAWEQAFLEGPGVPESPPMRMLVAEDGHELAYTDWVPDGWDGSGPMVVLVHGSSAYGELYGALGQGLAVRGVYARLIDVRGHGRSACPTEECTNREQPRTYIDDGSYWPGRPGDSLDADQIVRDLHAFVDDLRISWPNAWLLVAGHSSGAGVVARYVEQTGMAHLAGAMQLTPFHHPDQPQNALETWDCGRMAGSGYARVDLGAFGDGRRGNGHRYVLSFHKNDEYVTTLDTTQYSYNTVLGMAATGPDSFHDAFTKPTLWVAAEHDALLDLDISRQEFSRLANPQAFVEVRNTSHIGVSWSDDVAAVMADFAFDPQGASDQVIDPGA